MEEVRRLFESSRTFLDEKLDLVADVICARRRPRNSLKVSIAVGLQLRVMR